MTYRITLTGAAYASREQIAFSCAIEREQSPGVWVVVPGAPAQLLVDTAKLLAILRSTSQPPSELREALLELLRNSARSLPEVQAAVAIQRLEALLPAGWPVTVELAP
jgi:hypothetical protein